MQKLNRGFCLLGEIACIAMAVVLVFFMATSNSPLFLSAGSNSTIFLTVGKAITMGWTPYVDIVENKGPLLFLINALPQFVMERTLGIFIVELLLMVGAALLLHAARMLAGKKHCAICVLVPAVYFAYLSENLHGGNFGEEYNLFLTVVSIWAFIRAVSGQNKRTWLTPFLLGLCLLGVALIKISDIFGVGITVVFYLIWMARERRSFWKDAAAFVGGAALITVPIMVYLIARQAVGAMFQEYILSNFAHVGGESEAGFIATRLQLMQENTWYARNTLKPLFAGAGAAAVLVLCRFIGKRMNHEQKQPTSWLMITWIAGLAVMCFGQAYVSSTGYGQHLMPIAASLAASAMAAVAALCRLIPERAEGVRLAAGVASVLAGVILIIASPFSFEAAPRVGSEAYEAEMAYQREFLEIIEEEKDSVFGIGMPREWYLFNDIMPAYKCMNLVNYIRANVGENRAEDFEASLQEEPITWLVVKDTLENYRGVLTDGTLDFIYENYYLYCVDESGSRELYRLF